MKIRSKDFERSKDEYSVTEVDWYLHIPYGIKYNIKEDHRLSLRKNTKTGKYEVYKYCYLDKINEVVFESESLKQAVDEANAIMKKYWNYMLNDEVEE